MQDAAKELYDARKFKESIEGYERAEQLCELVLRRPEHEQKGEVHKLLAVCKLNRSLCYFQSQQFEQSYKCSSEVIRHPYADGTSKLTAVIRAGQSLSKLCAKAGEEDKKMHLKDALLHCEVAEKMIADDANLQSNSSFSVSVKQLRKEIADKQPKTRGVLQLPPALAPVALQLFTVLEQLHHARMYVRRCSAQQDGFASVPLPDPMQRLRIRNSLPLYKIATSPTAAQGHRQHDGHDATANIADALFESFAAFMNSATHEAFERSQGQGAEDNVPTVMMGRRHRVRAMCGAFIGRIVLLISQGSNCGMPPLQRHMDSILRRIASGRVTLMVQELQARAQSCRSKGHCVLAAKILKQAIALGSLASRADLADMLIDGREGIPEDRKAALDLVKHGAQRQCHHCEGVMSRLLQSRVKGSVSLWDCFENSDNYKWLARRSAAKGSRYGQYVLAVILMKEDASSAEAVRLLELAAGQNYEEAQTFLGAHAQDRKQDSVEALRWFKQAAAQGLSFAL